MRMTSRPSSTAGEVCRNRWRNDARVIGIEMARRIAMLVPDFLFMLKIEGGGRGGASTRGIKPGRDKTGTQLVFSTQLIFFQAASGRTA